MNLNWMIVKENSYKDSLIGVIVSQKVTEIRSMREGEEIIKRMQRGMYDNTYNK